MREVARQRPRTALPVRLLPEKGEPVAGTLLDVSPTGAFVELERPLEVGASAEVELPGEPAARLPATVVRAGRMHKPVRHPTLEHLVVRVSGVGLRFKGLAAEQSVLLGQFLSKLEESQS